MVAKKTTKVGRPGTKDPSAKKEKKTRKPHPGIVGKRIEAIPNDYDPAVHQPPKRKEFASDRHFFEWRADELDAKAEDMRKKAKEASQFGSAADKSKAKRLKNMVAKMAELKQQLEESGIDVDEILDSEE